MPVQSMTLLFLPVFFQLLELSPGQSGFDAEAILTLQDLMEQ